MNTISPEDITPDEPGPVELSAADDPTDIPQDADTTATDPEESVDGQAEDVQGEAEPDVGSLGTVDQLPAQDTLEDTGGRDRLDESIAPPEESGPLAEETVADQVTAESLNERAQAEEPEVWEG